MNLIRRQGPGVVLGVIAVALAITGAAVAAGNLKLGMFDDSSRDRLAGTGVIQYATAAHVTPATVADANTVHRFEVKCELDKRATAGGFRWTATPPNNGDWQLVDAYPTSQGYVIRIQIDPGSTAENAPLAVHANCVKSRAQRGTAPS